MLKPFIAAMAAVLTIVPGAQAQSELNHKAIASHLRSIGVTTSYEDCKGSGHNPGMVSLGSYNFVTNHFCISNRIQDRAMFEQTVVHELVHVIQDCLAGGINSPEMGSITRWMSGGDVLKEKEYDKVILSRLIDNNKIDHVDTAAGHLRGSQFMEREAYFLEDQPELVLNILSECKPR